MNLVRLLPVLTCAVLFFQPEVAQAGEFKKTKESVQQKFYEITGKDTSVISFLKGSATLLDAGEADLRTTMKAVQEDFAIIEIIVLAFADSAAPRGDQDDLSETSQALARSRGAVVKARIETLGGKNVTVHNMATKASWLEKAFGMTEAQVKREGTAATDDDTADDSFYLSLGRRMVTEGKPQTVVVVMRKQGPYSH